MTFPTIVSASNDAESAGPSTSHVLDLPSGSTGDLLLAIVVYDEPGTGPAVTSFPGHTFLSRHRLGSAPDAWVESWYRVTDGSEGSTVTVTTSFGCQMGNVIQRITGYSGVPVEAGWAGNVAVGVTSVDCPPLTSGMGSVDKLFVAAIAYNSLRTIVTIPSGYTAGETRQSIGTAWKQATNADEDPGSFVLSSDSWQIANTYAIAGIDVFAADFTANPTSGPVPLSVGFTDTSHGGTGTVDTWLWDFGDGSTSTSQDPTHIYTVPGVYSVTLTAETDDAETDSITKTTLITAGTDYVPPDPGNAVIEIYVSVVGSARWGVAHWGESVWSSAQWVDVTPQSIDAVVRWGSHQPEAGVLAETEAASWIVDTYDPGRLLDPGNGNSPYQADLRAGLPIRVRHRGTIVRQGVCETIAYYHAGKQGGIRVTDNLSLLARSPVPDDTILSDTLRARARDVIAAAGLAVTVEPDPPSGDPALAPRLEGDRSAWRHIADAAEQVLHVAYIDRIGTLKFRAWAAPYDRNRGVDGTNLVDVGTIVQTRGLYSVVQAQQTVGDGGALIERRLTPTPRYGAVTYKRSDPTPDADDWAAAVLADRSLQTVQWIPGLIYPLSADDVEYFATLEAMERFGVDHATADPPVDITGIIVGGEFRVTGKKDSAAVWGFQLELAQTAQSPLYTDTDPAEFLLNETGDGYLYAD